MVDIFLPYGGAMTWTPQGTPVFVKDVPGAPLATEQQCEVLVLTNPRPVDVNGNPNGRPDNLFYPDRGGGLAAIVGSRPLPQNLDRMRARILKALLEKAGIAPAPIPVVTVESDGDRLLVRISAYTTTGDVVNISSPIGG